MAKIIDGTPVDAATTNAALLGRNADDTATGIISLANTNPVSGTTTTNIQREHNSIASFAGKSLNSVKNDLPTYGNNEGFSANEDLRTRADGLTGKFHSTTGHGHSGGPGDGPQIDSGDIGSVILKGFGIQGTTLIGVTGTSTDVTTELTGKSPSNGDTQKGVVVNTPYNKVLLRDENDDEFKTLAGDTVYGRVTESSGTWTLTYYYLNGTVETSYNFLASVDVKWYYQELINYISDTGYVYSPMFFIPSDNATTDVVDASTTQRGVVSTGTQSFAGSKTFTDGAVFEDSVRWKQAVDSSTTGSNQTVTLTQPYIEFTNASLASIEMISGTADSRMFVWTNKTGATISILNDTGATASQRIMTGTGNDLDVENDASIWGIYDTNSSRWRIIGGSGSGTGSSVAKNYLPLGNAESTNPFVMYADGSAQPVDGTGGSPSATITQSTSSPLAGVKSFLFNSGGLGDGGSYPFTINAEDKSSMQTLLFSTDGAFASGDLSVWLYDVTNSVLISPQPVPELSPSFGKQQFIFQLGTGTSYRFLVHQATANSFTAKFEVSLSAMQFAGYSPFTKDLESYTPTIVNITTPTNVDFKWMQRGEMLYVEGYFDGSGGTGPSTVTLPNGVMVSSKLSASNYTVVGVGFITSNHHEISLLARGGDNFLTFGLNFPGGTGTLPYNGAWASEKYVFTFEVPIEGWTGESKIISEYDGRVVAARYEIPNGKTSDPSNPIDASTKTYDTHESVTTGASWKFTAPIAGYYHVTCNVSFGASAVDIYLYKNGTLDSFINTSTSTNGGHGAVEVLLLAGEYIDIRSGASATTGGPAGTITVSLLSGAQKIIAGQKIEASYWVTSNQVFDDTTPINFDSKEFDTVGAVTTGSGWKFTAPVSATYSLSMYLPLGVAGSASICIYKNGTIYKAIGYVLTADNNSIASLIQLSAGDYIDIRAFTGSAATIGGHASLSNPNAANIAIKQVN